MTLAGAFRLALVAVLTCAGFGASANENYPEQPIRLIVPFPAGGGSDSLARSLAAALSKQLGQPVIAENQPGASTMIATQTVVSAPADGYTILFSTNSMATNIAMKGDDMPYDAFEDLDPVSLYTVRSSVLLAKPALGVSTFQQMLDLAKQKPGLTVGTSGIGGGGHFATELIKDAAKVDLVHVPYGGAAPSLLDLIGGRIDMVFVSSESALPHIQSGAAIPLAVTTLKRSQAVLPDVPTVAETLPGFEVATWNGVMVPDGTPESIIAKLNQAVNQAVCCDEELTAAMASADAIPNAGTPEAMRDYMVAEIDRLKPIIERAGIKPE